MPVDTKVRVEWKPNVKQAYFLSLPDDIKEALYGGAAGGGKSEVLLLFPLLRGFHEFPRFKGIIFRRTYPELYREIIERSFNWYPHAGGTYNSEKKQWQFPSRAIIRFGHMEYERDARDYDSDEYNYIAFDELTSFTEFQYTYLFSRNRTSDKRLPAIVRSGTNPGNIGHGWVLNRFIEPQGKIVPWGTILYDKRTKHRRIFIQATLKDNEEHIDPSYYDTLAILPEAERKAKRDGDWHSFSGQVFGEFRPAHVEGEPEYAFHVVPNNTYLPAWWPRFVVIDWGFSANNYCLWCCVSPNGRLYFYREYAIKRAKISLWASEFKEINNGETDRVLMCQSAWQNRGEEFLIAEEFEKYSKIHPMPVKNDRVAGKMMLHEYLRWEQIKRTSARNPQEYSQIEADQILRIKGWDAYVNYTKEFEVPAPETNLPKLQIFERCEMVKRVIPLCVYANKSNVSNKDSEDVAEFPGDDPYDVARYACMEANTLSLDSVVVEKNKAIAEITKQLVVDNDQTAFYRKMEHTERKFEDADIAPVRLVGRRFAYAR